MIEKSFVERFGNRMRAVFSDHKTEMAVTALIGFVLGAVLL